MPRLKLTAGSLKAAKPGDVLVCPDVRGLELRCKLRTHSWQYYYRAPDGTQRRPKIGEYPTLSLEAARRAARDMAAKVASGHDPSRQRTDLRAAPTVADACGRYMREWAEARKRPRSVDEDRRLIQLHVLPAIGALKVADVRQRDVNALLTGVAGKGSPVAANRTRTLLHKLFNLCETEDWSLREPNSNPVTNAIRQVERRRKRFVRDDEAAAIWAELDKLRAEQPGEFAACCVILYAGSRVTELLSADWSEYRGDRIERAVHKTMRTGEDRIIYLPEQARALIDALPKRPGLPIFGGVDRFAAYRFWIKARARAAETVPSCAELTLRDLRRTFASVAKSAGKSLDTVGELFGHRHAETTGRYAFLYDDAATGAAQSVADKIDSDLLKKKV